MDQESTGAPIGQPPAVAGGGTSGGLLDFLTFRSFIAPPLIVFLWVLTVAGITFIAAAAYKSDHVTAVLGWVFAVLWGRVVFEVVAVLFRINDGIQTIARRR